MSLVNFFKRIFCNDSDVQTEENYDIPGENGLSELESAEEPDIQLFASENVVFDKLSYLEQYIKIFSLTFPKEYGEYLLVIQKLKKNYAEELERFENGKKGNITFSIDPEAESQRYVEVMVLEENIKRFVEFEVDYKFCVDRFSKLCYKLNVFYNAIIDTKVSNEQIVKQLANAQDSLGMLVSEVIQRAFFNEDSRKKDNILNYIIYCDYIVFKAYLRVGKVTGIDEYKQVLSKIYSSFSNEHYDNLFFKFFIEGIEQLQLLINENLDKDKMFIYPLKESQALERKLDSYDKSFNDEIFFEEIIKLENTVCSLIKVHKIKFSFDVSKLITFVKTSKEIISINNIAKTLLSLVGSRKAIFLQKIIDRFSVEISWREFYFLCKIFEVKSDVISVSINTVFNMVQTNFAKLAEKYQDYTDEYILNEKKKVLNYCGSKTKKYILLLEISQDEISDIKQLLTTLSLDFVIQNNVVYLNYSYFNGFKNLQVNFGQVVTF